ncbi:unnamed protein product, partial [Porites lobata]
GADLSNVLQLRNVCLYVLSYLEGFMTVKVDKSKIDQLRQGDEVVIAQSEGNVCPVFLLKENVKKL